MKLSFKNLCSPAFFLAILCSSIAFTQFQEVQRLSRDYSSVQDYHLSDAQLAVTKSVPSVGFQNIVANWSFIQFLQYFGDDEVRNRVGYGDSAKYLSVAIHHDPYFRELYVFLSGSSTIFAGKPKDTVRVMSEGIAQIGERRAPDSYYIWRYKGTDELLFLNDSQSAQKSFETAAQWAAQSDDVNGSLMSQLSTQTAQFLSNNPDSSLAQINAWGSILTTALNEETRQRAVAKIRELGGDVFVTDAGQIQIEYSKSENHPNGSQI